MLSVWSAVFIELCQGHVRPEHQFLHLSVVGCHGQQAKDQSANVEHEIVGIYNGSLGACSTDE
jgi:hypothetical protein